MKAKGLKTLVVLVLLSAAGFAQQTDKRFGFELNIGASEATKKLEGSNLNTGFGFEGTLHYRMISNLGLYGGWGWNRFGSDQSFAGKDVSFEETGYVLGLSYGNPIIDSKLSYYVRVGGLYNHIETENADGNLINDSKHGIGYQVAGGLDINLGSNWSLTPGFKFNSLSRETDFEGVTKNLDYQYMSVRVGFMKRF